MHVLPGAKWLVLLGIGLYAKDVSINLVQTSSKLPDYLKMK